MPKVSVYLPTHNYASYIGQAIKSVLAQTMGDWELIVIDDGSTDNTKEVLANYKGHPKIRIIEQENKGLNVTNNIALRLSNGRYIIRLDADDYFDENILLVLSNILDNNRDVGLVYPDYYIINGDGEVIENVRLGKTGVDVELLDLPAHGACTMIRKECLLDLEGYDEEFACQDGYDLWLRFIKKYNPYNVNIPLFYYRKHPKSLTSKKKKILRTRHSIHNKHVDQYYNGQRPRVLGIIPVAGDSAYSQSKPFNELAGKPLLWYTINEVRKAKYLDKVVVSSDDEDVLEYTQRFSGIDVHKRTHDLAKQISRIEDTAMNVLQFYEQSEDYVPDAVCMLYITTPLRKAHHIDNAVDTLTIFQADSVISVENELSYCYFHGRHGLTPISTSARHLRLEREAVYKENGAVIMSRTDIIKQGRLLGKSIAHIVMLPEESIKINSEFEFWLAEKIIQDYEKSYQEKACVSSKVLDSNMFG